MSSLLVAMYESVSDRLFTSEWSIFSLPEISTQSRTGYPSYIELYHDIFTNPDFICLFILGLIIFYVFDILGCYIYRHYVPLDHQQKMQCEQFAGHFISMIHALMIAISSTLVTIYYKPLEAFNASPNEPIILSYKVCATWSASYFLLDSIFISYYYNQGWNKKIAFIIHHSLSGICMCVVLWAHPIAVYISALNFLIEWSTVCLNIRIFARIWSMKMTYFIAGWSVIISYPFTRIIWNFYLILISFYSPYLIAYTVPEAPVILGGAEIFVCLLSTYYYFTVIMAKPQNMYILKNAPKPMEKDC